MTLHIGQGVDAHRLVGGRRLMLGGVEIPHDRGLLGHSDGDVAVHALCDAVLGAAGLGDLGSRFPSAEERWRGAPGRLLLGEVRRVLAEHQAALVSAQVVVIAEQPRLADHLQAMAACCAGALGVGATAVVVSVTSTDGLGFTGRGEGIAATAVAIVDRPPAP